MSVPLQSLRLLVVQNFRMTKIWTFLIHLTILLSKFLTCSMREENLSKIHPSMISLYQEMSNSNQSTRNVYKVLAIPGKVKSEVPCRVHFKIPKTHHQNKVIKIDLHIKVLPHLHSSIQSFQFLISSSDFWY